MNGGTGDSETGDFRQDRPAGGIAGARSVAMLMLALERLWPLLVPAVMVALVFAIVSWFGLWQAVAPLLRFVLTGAFAVVFLVSVLKLRHFRLPTRVEAARRVEVASQLADRPLTAQDDAMSFGQADGFARALWEEHRRRMAQRLDHLSSGAPRPDLSKTDPWAMRAALALVAFVAFGYSFSPGGGRIADSWRPASDPAELLSRLDAWINPPSYTRKPPLFLTRGNLAGGNLAGGNAAEGGSAEERVFQAPQGSQLVVRFVGDGEISLRYRDGKGATDIAPAAPKEGEAARSGADLSFEHQLTASGMIEVVSGERAIAQWPVEIQPDGAPTIRFTETPKAALSGSLELAYEVSDDYGVIRAIAEITSNLPQDPGARPLVEAPEVVLPLPRQRARSGASKVNRDLTAHPWAGSPVSIRLAAQDDSNQKGYSETVEMRLPGRRFANPLAMALVEQRRILALDANKARRVADMLDAVLVAPEEFIKDAGAFMTIGVAHRRLVLARNDDDLRSVMDLLWETALAIEFGDLSEAEQRLREAQEKLSEALERGASDEEIAQLMDELRKAMEEMMRMLAEQALQNPVAQNPLDNNEMSQMLRQRDLERMLDRIEDLARSGSRDAARELLSELQRMMDNLRAGRHMQQRQAEGNRTNRALDKLGELMREQQRLMDETFRMQQRRQQQQQGQQQQGQQQQGQQQEQRGQRQGGENGEQQPGQGGNQQAQGEQGEMTAEEFAEALRQLQEQQEALRDQLEQLGEELEALGMQPSPEFGEAGREMGEAESDLGQSRPGDAAGNQGQALDALRRGAQQMMQQMAGDRQQGGTQPGQGSFGGSDRQRSDPLGRSQGADGLETGDDTKVPGEIDAQRAREIMEAIRKRLSEPYSPVIEKEYLERLLEDE
jgi:uncharacterized protein (TIGR02302 family)